MESWLSRMMQHKMFHSITDLPLSADPLFFLLLVHFFFNFLSVVIRVHLTLLHNLFLCYCLWSSPLIWMVISLDFNTFACYYEVNNCLPCLGFTQCGGITGIHHGTSKLNFFTETVALVQTAVWGDEGAGGDRELRPHNKTTGARRPTRATTTAAWLADPK